MQLSSIELRTLVAAQIASGLVGQVAPDSPQGTIDPSGAARCKNCEDASKRRYQIDARKGYAALTGRELRPGAFPEQSPVCSTCATSG